MKNVNSKKLAIIFLTGFVLIGTTSCKKSELNKDSDLKRIELEKENIIDQIDKEQVFEEETSEINKSTEEIIEIIETENKDFNEQSSDDIINDYLNDINKKINSDDIKVIKDTITSTFITLVDFIYYDEKIYGITYDELSDATKQNVLDSFNLIDSIIDKSFPDYKETLSSKYNNLKEKISNTVYDKVGEDNWNKLEDAKNSFSDSLNNIGDVTKDLTDSGKTKVKTWYEQFKEDHK